MPPMVNMPLVYDHTIPEKPIEKVTTQREFMISCIELMKDETLLNELCEMIDHCTQEWEIPATHRVLNHVMHKKRNNKEFILSA